MFGESLGYTRVCWWYTVSELDQRNRNSSRRWTGSWQASAMRLRGWRQWQYGQDHRESEQYSTNNLQRTCGTLHFHLHKWGRGWVWARLCGIKWDVLPRKYAHQTTRPTVNIRCLYQEMLSTISSQWLVGACRSLNDTHRIRSSILSLVRHFQLSCSDYPRSWV